MSTTPTVSQDSPRIFRRSKETKNKVIFMEVPPAGQAPIVETLYVAKWWIGTAQEITVTINK